MIRFACSNCGRHISVDDKCAGRNGKCPKCGTRIVVPERSTIIAFHCEGCGQKIKVPEHYAGKKGKCPKCKNPILIPSFEAKLAEGAGTVTVTCPMCAEAVEIAAGTTEEFVECPGCGSYVETAPQSVPDVSEESGAAATQTAEEGYYEEDPEALDRSVGIDHRLIVIISAAAAVVVVGLIILAAVLRSSGQRAPKGVTDRESLTQSQLNQVEAFAERYIGLLENDEIDKALQSHSPGFAAASSRMQIAGLAKRIGVGRVTEMDCTRTRARPHPEGDQILLWYNLRYERGRQAVILSVVQIEQELMIDGIAIWRSSGHTMAAGPKTRDALRAAARAASEKSRSFLTKFYGSFMVVILIFALIQVVSMWIVFEKAGQPGWASLVPFYNMWALAEIGDRPGWMGVAMCFCGLIPIACVGQITGLIFWVIISIGVARAFDHGFIFAMGLTFVPSIFYPILAFRRD